MEETMRSRFTPVLILVLLLTAAVSARAADKVDEYVKAEMQKQRIPGLSLAVVKDGKIIKAAGYGMANVEHNIPVKPETVFKIGSVSKQFIATGILLLIQDGKISFDDKISKFLEGTPETWKEITIRHLLTHTSGIVREAPGFDPLKIQNDADVIKTAYDRPLRFAPGEKYEYCNVGYFSLAEIIRKVSGKPWPDFLNERVFTPLGMNASRTTDVTAIVQNRAGGYYWKDGKLQNAPEYRALRPSGAFLSTVLDLAKWDAALYGEGLLKASIRDQMWVAVKLNNGTTHPYGFGWELSTIGGHRMVHHGGSLPGFRAQLARLVDDKLTVIVLTNGDNAIPQSIAQGVADLYIPGLIPQRIVAKVDPKIFDAYAGRYQPNPAIVVTIAREGDKLMMTQGTGPQKIELLPESEATFFTEDNRRRTLTFVKDEKGQVTHILIKVEGRETGRAPRLQ
jgi:CubicO group peptidase (beta-lactamase class C family)